MSTGYIPHRHVDRGLPGGVTLAAWRRETVAAEDRVLQSRAGARRAAARRRLLPRLGAGLAFRPRFA